MTDLQINNFKAVALASEFNDEIKVSNAVEAVTAILYHQVIERRIPCLDSMKMALRNSGILSFTNGRSYLRGSIFPRNMDTVFPKEIVADMVRAVGDENSDIKTYVKTYISNIEG